jgi:heptosyltransferase I
MAAASVTLRTPPPGRVLILLLGSIGDVVRALPLLGRMRESWPAAHLAWAVEPKSEPVLRSHPWLNELIVYDRTRAPWSFVPFLRRIRRGRFDVVVDLQRHLKSGITSLWSGAPERWGFAAANVKEFNHWFSNRQITVQPRMRLKLEQYQVFGDALGLASTPLRFGLEPSPEVQARVARILADTPRPRLGVILGSSWPSRLYFPESVAAVIRNLAAQPVGVPGLFPILIGGREELALALAVQRELRDLPVLDLTGKTRLEDLAGIFAACDVACGPDSGPMHIAAAVGCPVVSLWGATAAVRSAPWGSAEFALSAEIPCSPCYLRRCPIGGECMRRIAPEDVAAMVRRASAAGVRTPMGPAMESAPIRQAR